MDWNHCSTHLSTTDSNYYLLTYEGDSKCKLKEMIQDIRVTASSGWYFFTLLKSAYRCVGINNSNTKEIKLSYLIMRDGLLPSD
jgi:hypothetical protein